MGKLQVHFIDQGESLDIRRSKAKAHVARFVNQRYLDNKSHQLRTRLAKERVVSRQLQPPIAWHGNSDPFDSQAIVVTAETNRLLSFLLHVWLPQTQMQSSNAVDEGFRLAIKRRINASYISALHECWSAAAVLLPCSSMLAKLAPSRDIQQHSVGLKADTAARLRAAIIEDSQQDEMMWLTQALFINAVSAGDFAEAKSHGNALQWMMRRKTDRDGLESLDSDLLYQTLFYEVYRANLTLGSSVFDIDNWGMAVMRAHSPDVCAIMDSHFEVLARETHESIRSTPLESFATGFRQGIWLFQNADLFLRDERIVSQMWTLMTINYELEQLRCTNYYVLANDLATKHHEHASEARYWHVQACICLALLLCTVNHIIDPRLAGRSYWPRSQKLADALNDHLHRALGDYGSSQQHKSALLFAAWAGATYIYKESFSFEILSKSSFCNTFARLSTEMRLKTWEDMVAVIDRFMPGIVANSQQQTDIRNVLMSASLSKYSDDKADLYNSCNAAHIIQKHFQALLLS